MPGIDAERANLITKQITIAVGKKLQASDDNKNVDVSIFIKDMTDEEKEFAYREYSKLLLEMHYDLDGNGTITAEEFAKREKQDLVNTVKSLNNGVANSGQIGLAERHGYLFAQNLDVNGDGTISIDEFSYFNKEIDVADDDNGKEQDGKLTVASSNTMFKSYVGTNAKGDSEHSKKIKEITEKYLAGKNLTEEEQKILNEASTEIREEAIKTAKEKFNMDLGTAKEQKVYHGDLDQSTIGAAAGNVTAPDPKAVQLMLMNFMSSMFQSNRQIADALTLPGMGMGGLGGMMPMGGMMPANAINFLANPAQQTAPQVPKAFQWGNILGQGLNFAAMLRGVFGGGGFGGGLNWWFRS